MPDTLPNTLAGFPFWTLQFDDDGRLTQPAAAEFVQQISAKSLTDLFIFSHGWNNSQTDAMLLYTGFFGELEKLMNDASIPKRPEVVAGAAGVLWPSILFPGDTAPLSSGGAASFNSTVSAKTLNTELPKLFPKPEHQPHLQTLLQLLDDQPPDNESLFAFRDALSQLLQAGSSQNTTAGANDDLELQAATVQSDDDWLRMLDAFSVQPSVDADGFGGGAADFGSYFGRLWNGAKNLLRVGSYWQMKNRAGVVGRKGLGPLLGQLQQAAPNLRIHLIGHSFGARLVSYSLAGLPDGAVGQKSPVKSLFLLQGAFSHFAFADALPFDPSRKGDLAGMAARVDGPLLTTHSLKDLAVGNAYPAASIVGGADASAATDLLYRWEGMGHDGAQGVNAQNATLCDVKIPYSFQTGQWTNLDGNQVIVEGGPPSGAHGDIVHPQTAWAALAASKVAG